MGDLSLLGHHPLVLIDGKEYPDDILYKIGKSCIANSSTRGKTPDGKPWKGFASKSVDGVVIITTTNHKITYLTKIETENLAIEAAVPQNKFYARIRLKNADGSEFNKGIVQLPHGGMTISFDTNDKVVFLIDGKGFSEAEITQVEDYIKTHKITGEYGTGPVSEKAALTKPYVGKYQIYFSFTIDTNKTAPKTGFNIKPRSKFDKALVTYANSPEGQQKTLVANAIKGKTLTYKVTAFVNADRAAKVNEYFKLTNNSNQVVLYTGGDQFQQLKKSISVGDEIEMNVLECASSINGGPLSVMPLLITKNNKTVFRLPRSSRNPQRAFSYKLNGINDAPVICIKTTPDVIPTGKLFADNPMLYSAALCKKSTTTIAN